MRKLTLITLAAICFILFSCLTACKSDAVRESEGLSRSNIISKDHYGSVTKHVIDGHHYLTYTGGGMLHSASCPNDK